MKYLLYNRKDRQVELYEYNENQLVSIFINSKIIRDFYSFDILSWIAKNKQYITELTKEEYEQKLLELL